MKKRRPDPRPRQDSAVAELVRTYWTKPMTWHYVDAGACHSTTNWSRGFKTREQAISAAVAAGFKRVRFEGKLVVDARNISHDEEKAPVGEIVQVIPTMSSSQDEDPCLGRKFVRILSDEELVDLYHARYAIHSPDIVEEICSELTRRCLAVDV